MKCCGGREAGDAASDDQDPIDLYHLSLHSDERIREATLRRA